MKMMYKGTPIQSLNIKHFEVSTNDATLKSSDLQAGVTAYAKGKKVTGTGKAFSFAMYGDTTTTAILPIPERLNVLSITSHEYPVQMSDRLFDLQDRDFTIEQEIGKIVVEGVEHPIKAMLLGNILRFTCNHTVSIQFFCGKDNYI